MADDWKQKYLTCLDRQEQSEAEWQAAESLLRQGLTRVALAAQGIDARLDRELDRLRKAIRSGATAQALEPIIEDIADAVVRLDEQRAAEAAGPTAQAVLADWVDTLALPQVPRASLRRLRRRFVQAGDATQLEAPLRELAELLGSEAGAAPAGLMQRLFGQRGGVAGEAGEAGGVEDEADAGASPGDASAPVAEFCIQLLDTLSLPSELEEEAERLRERLAAGLVEQGIAPALAALADLISRMRLQMEAEKAELQAFLRQLTGGLQDLDQSLAGAKDRQRDAVDSSRELSKAVRAQVQHIETSVDETDDPQQLKQAVQQRLEAIRRHLDEYRESDEARQQRLEAELVALNQRVQEMEREGEQLRERLREKHEQAVHDPLTGLYNRLAFDERMAQEFARWKRYRQPMVLLVVDIDRFKRINDTYGHKAGDKALKIIAERILGEVRESDFLARYGGEEFVILMPETTLADGRQVADKLRANVAKSQFHYQGEAVTITVSLGVAAPREGDTPESLFQRADQALYRAKESGRDRVVSEDEL